MRNLDEEPETLFFIDHGYETPEHRLYRSPEAIRLSLVKEKGRRPYMLMTESRRSLHLLFQMIPVERTTHIYLTATFRRFLSCSHLPSIRALLKKVEQGVCWSEKNQEQSIRLFDEVDRTSGEKQLIELIRLLSRLAATRYRLLLSTATTFEYRSIENTYFRSKRMRTVDNYIRTHITQPFSTADLASTVHMTTPAFCKWFRKQRACSPVQHVNNIRLGLIKEELTASDDSLSNICFRYGFDSLSYFTRLFVRETGMSPKRWRRKYRKG